MRRVGIFSGTFDPVHEGHLAFARQALTANQLDKIFFLVEPRPRRKQGVRAFEHRQKMVELAIKDEPALGSIVLEQARFTAQETLPILQARFKGAELFMLMGDDMLHHLGDWPHVDELLRGVGFIIGLRQDSPEAVTGRLQALEQARGLKLRYHIFQADHYDHSSSKIRQAYKNQRLPVGVPSKVAAYIKRQGLYEASRDQQNG